MGERGLFKMHQAHAKEAAALRWGRIRLTEVTNRSDPRRWLANEVERHVAGELCTLGYHVQRRGHNARYDLLVDGVLKVEVKAARWHANGARGRYQAHYHNRGDILIFCPVNGKVHHFLIPSAAMPGTVNLAIWSHEPADYGGNGHGGTRDGTRSGRSWPTRHGGYRGHCGRVTSTCAGRGKVELFPHS